MGAGGLIEVKSNSTLETHTSCPFVQAEIVKTKINGFCFFQEQVRREPGLTIRRIRMDGRCNVNKGTGSSDTIVLLSERKGTAGGIALA